MIQCPICKQMVDQSKIRLHNAYMHPNSQNIANNKTQIDEFYSLPADFDNPNLLLAFDINKSLTVQFTPKTCLRIFYYPNQSSNIYQSEKYFQSFIIASLLVCDNFIVLASSDAAMVLSKNILNSVQNIFRRSSKIYLIGSNLNSFLEKFNFENQNIEQYDLDQNQTPNLKNFFNFYQQFVNKENKLSERMAQICDISLNQTKLNIICSCLLAVIFLEYLNQMQLQVSMNSNFIQSNQPHNNQQKEQTFFQQNPFMAQNPNFNQQFPNMSLSNFSEAFQQFPHPRNDQPILNYNTYINGNVLNFPPTGQNMPFYAQHPQQYSNPQNYQTNNNNVYGGQPQITDSYYPNPQPPIQFSFTPGDANQQPMNNIFNSLFFRPGNSNENGNQQQFNNFKFVPGNQNQQPSQPQQSSNPLILNFTPGNSIGIINQNPQSSSQPQFPNNSPNFEFIPGNSININSQPQPSPSPPNSLHSFNFTPGNLNGTQVQSPSSQPSTSFGFTFTPGNANQNKKQETGFDLGIKDTNKSQQPPLSNTFNFIPANPSNNQNKPHQQMNSRMQQPQSNESGFKFSPANSNMHNSVNASKFDFPLQSSSEDHSSSQSQQLNVSPAEKFGFDFSISDTAANEHQSGLSFAHSNEGPNVEPPPRSSLEISSHQVDISTSQADSDDIPVRLPSSSPSQESDSGSGIKVEVDPDFNSSTNSAASTNSEAPRPQFEPDREAGANEQSFAFNMRSNENQDKSENGFDFSMDSNGNNDQEKQGNGFQFNENQYNSNASFDINMNSSSNAKQYRPSNGFDFSMNSGSNDNQDKPNNGFDFSMNSNVNSNQDRSNDGFDFSMNSNDNNNQDRPNNGFDFNINSGSNDNQDKPNNGFDFDINSNDNNNNQNISKANIDFNVNSNSNENQEGLNDNFDFNIGGQGGESSQPVRQFNVMLNFENTRIQIHQMTEEQNRDHSSSHAPSTNSRHSSSSPPPSFNAIDDDDDKPVHQHAEKSHAGSYKPPHLRQNLQNQNKAAYAPQQKIPPKMNVENNSDDEEMAFPPGFSGQIFE